MSSGGGAGSGKVLVDYKLTDYRGFIFIVHDVYGLLLLRCTRKKDKPPHWQVPGGHVDEPEFLTAAQMSDDRNTQLLLACKMGAARELFEETGMDLRDNLNRFEPAALRTENTFSNKRGVEVLTNEYKKRLFYFLSVTDSDFPTDGGKHPMGKEGKNLMLKLSVEHQGWLFQPEPPTAAELLKLHSGGKVTEALLMAMKKDSGSPKQHLTVGVSDNGQNNNDDDEVEEKAMSSEQAAGAVIPPVSGVSSVDGSIISTDSMGRPKRRGKREKSITIEDKPNTIDIPPRPEKKNTFCCFKW